MEKKSQGRPIDPQYREIYPDAKSEWSKHGPRSRPNHTVLLKWIEDEFPQDKLKQMCVWDKPTGAYVYAAYPPWTTVKTWIRRWVAALKASGLPDVEPEDKVFQSSTMKELLDIPWEDAGWVASTIEAERFSWFLARAVRYGVEVGNTDRLVYRDFNDAVPLGLAHFKAAQGHFNLQPRTFSGRQIQWWWRIHRAYPTLPTLDTVALGNECWRRHTLAQAEGKTPDVNDILSWCHYHSTDQMAGYEAAVELGQVEPFKMTILKDIKKPGGASSGDPDIVHDARRYDRMTEPVARADKLAEIKAVGERVAADQAADQAYRDSVEEHRLAVQAQEHWRNCATYCATL
jgi:hypothetical protein